MSGKKTLKIGNAGGYWGDDPTALKRQIDGGHLDYVTMDFLAEVTMSIMQKQRAKDSKLGFARDFIPMIEQVLPQIMKNGTRIITNAGGVNPEACAEAIAATANKLGLSPRIAVVYGDDILHRISEMEAKGCKFANMETGASFSGIRDRIEAANVYFGAAPVVEALRWNPDIVITGRVTDTGITLAAMIHEFGWDLTDWDKLASGIVAGHLIECGAQVTGGNFTDWKSVKNFKNIGYPIIEMESDGTFVITKHSGTGGAVTLDTVREQLFYEMGNPKGYITPDVVADFSSIHAEPAGKDRVRIFGVKGYEPTDSYKVSMAFGDGAKIIGSIAISGPDARAKAESFAGIFWDRVGHDYIETSTEYFGWNACHRSLGGVDDGAEIMLRLGARADSDSKLKLFSKMVPSLILGGPPGVTVMGGAPKPQDVVSYWPALMPKRAITPRMALFIEGSKAEEREADGNISGTFKVPQMSVQTAQKPKKSIAKALAGQSKKGLLPLSTICLGRSGDKGDTANIGLLARSPKAFAFIEKNITAQQVKDWFQELCHGPVVRYSLPGLLGLNFLLEESLGGGGTMTLRTDAQGKTFAQALLRQRVKIPADVLKDVRDGTHSKRSASKPNSKKTSSKKPKKGSRRK